MYENSVGKSFLDMVSLNRRYISTSSVIGDTAVAGELTLEGPASFAQIAGTTGFGVSLRSAGVVGKGVDGVGGLGLQASMSNSDILWCNPLARMLLLRCMKSSTEKLVVVALDLASIRSALLETLGPATDMTQSSNVDCG